MSALDDALPVETIDEANPAANMYGATPCPKCGSRYRWPDRQHVLRCDECGYLATWRREDAPEARAWPCEPPF
jgi:DNA-directed RNA polymerase subunit RPC12/RpoP